MLVLYSVRSQKAFSNAIFHWILLLPEGGACEEEDAKSHRDYIWFLALSHYLWNMVILAYQFFLGA